MCTWSLSLEPPAPHLTFRYVLVLCAPSCTQSMGDDGLDAHDVEGAVRRRLRTMGIVGGVSALDETPLDANT